VQQSSKPQAFNKSSRSFATRLFRRLQVDLTDIGNGSK
jgi:hypothetical protein